MLTSRVTRTHHRRPLSRSSIRFIFFTRPSVGEKILRFSTTGVGAGEDLIPIATTGVDVIGLDISPELIEHARKRAETYRVSARFVVGSAYNTGLAPASVDIVFAMAIF